MSKQYYRKRWLRRAAFLKKYEKLVNQARSSKFIKGYNVNGQPFYSPKSIPAIKLIEKARKYVGYQDSTYSGDIFYTLMCFYRDLKENKII